MQDERDSNRACKEAWSSGGGGIMSGEASVENGKLGGRPKYGVDLKVQIPDIEFVILTPNQYGSLVEKYGYELFQKALLILENWLKTSPQSEKYRGKNNYAHFRADGWVINLAKSLD
mgnify:CR=1 FL=1